MEHLLHPDDALYLVLDHARNHPMKTETVPLEESLGRALPFTVSSLLDQPPFDKAAMDGYAYRRPAGVISRTERPYTVIDTLAAGSVHPEPLHPGEAVRIMTGAPVPPDTEGVWRVEWTTIEGGRVRFREREPVVNIIRRGENLGMGDPLVTPRILAPQDLGILAASGYGRIDVSAAPSVAVISTGDELREPLAWTHNPLAEEVVEKALGEAGIFDSNAHLLAARVRQAAARPVRAGIVPDEVERLVTAVGEALDRYDVVILSGGVSRGDFDHVPEVAGRLGVTGVFHELRMRPGKPTFFGTRGDRALFGLPGNPVSSFLACELFVVPYLLVRAGLTCTPPLVTCTLVRDLQRKSLDNVAFLPAHINWPEGTIEPLPYNGSSMITVLAGADALIRLEPGQEFLSEGTRIHARLIRPLH